MTTQKTSDQQASVIRRAVNPLIETIDAFLESSGSDSDIQQLNLSMEAIKRRNAEAKIPILNCTMEYECPKTWAELTPSPDPYVRHCPVCAKDVTFCTSQTQLEEISAQGACVAFRGSQARQMMGSVKPSERKVSKDELRSFIDKL